MAKNFAQAYAFTGDSTAVVQKLFAKVEVTKGTLIGPASADHFLHIGGGIQYAQPNESSPHKTGRHNTNTIKGKKTLAFGFQTYVNIDVGVGAGATELDAAIDLFWTSLMGLKTVSTGVRYDPTVPDVTFSLFENGDKWAQQSRGCFIQGCNIQLPGDGRATLDWSGNGKDTFRIGIGKSVTDNTGLNVITVGTGEGKRFRIGGLVMIIKANGTTRSTDTAAGTYRSVTAISTDDITLSGAVFADADGSSTPIYLCYYEPATPTAIDNPQTGLVGTFSIVGMATSPCARSLGINVQNNHELVDYCYGTDSLDSPFFVAGARLGVEVTMETNLNDNILPLLYDVEQVTAKNMTINLGLTSTRYLQFLLPKVIFQVPEISVPDTGSIPITFNGMAYQSALDAADELTVYYK